MLDEYVIGQARAKRMLAVADLADLILFDLKVIDRARHREFTGVDNEMILDNLRALEEDQTLLVQSGKPVGS